LHVIYDPFCGWCYGAAPLIEAARGIDGLEIVLHGGGMMAGNNRQQMTPALRDFILPHAQRITALSGQHFGEGYLAMLDDTSVWLDSTPPTMAIAAAAQWTCELDMLHRVQSTHFMEGRRIGEARVLTDIAEEIGIARQEFAIALATALQSAGDHIRESRALLKQVGGSGFPTFALESNGGFEMLASAQYLGRPEAWREMLEKLP